MPAGLPAHDSVVSRYLVICPTAPGRFDGVADYSCWLAAHLGAFADTHLVGLQDHSDAGGPTDVIDLPPVQRVLLESWRELWRNRRQPPLDHGTALIQYVPQIYLRGPDFGWLLLWLANLRLRGRGVTLTIHEYAVPGTGSLRRTAARILMLAMTIVLGSLASRIFVTFELPRRRLQRLLFWKAARIAVVPVGSNVPAAGQAGRISPSSEAVIATIFGQPEAMNAALVAAVAAWLRAERAQLGLRWIGRSRTAIETFLREQCGVSDGIVHVIDRQPSGTVAELLSSSDICLAPIVDGVSTRRTTVMAALASGLPIVGTDGPCTDAVLRQAEGCQLSPPEDGEAFVRNLASIVADAERRRHMGHSSRALFERHFTWERIAGTYRLHTAP